MRLILGSSSFRVKPRTIQLVFAISLLGTWHKGGRAMTGKLEIRIRCLSRVACLPADCCIDEQFSTIKIQLSVLIQYKVDKLHLMDM